MSKIHIPNKFQGVKSIYQDGKEIGKVDDTSLIDVKVILTDKKETYVQRFFDKSPLVKLVERTILMGSLGIESL